VEQTKHDYQKIHEITSTEEGEQGVLLAGGPSISFQPLELSLDPVHHHVEFGFFIDIVQHKESIALRVNVVLPLPGVGVTVAKCSRELLRPITHGTSLSFTGCLSRDAGYRGMKLDCDAVAKDGVDAARRKSQFVLPPAVRSVITIRSVTG
jgi:hypothetical protein